MLAPTGERLLDIPVGEEREMVQQDLGLAAKDYLTEVTDDAWLAFRPALDAYVLKSPNVDPHEAAANLEVFKRNLIALSSRVGQASPTIPGGGYRLDRAAIEAFDQLCASVGITQENKEEPVVQNLRGVFHNHIRNKLTDPEMDRRVRKPTLRQLGYLKSRGSDDQR